MLRPCLLMAGHCCIHCRGDQHNYFASISERSQPELYFSILTTTCNNVCHSKFEGSL